MSHTPGPWHAEYFPHAFGWDVTHGPADDSSQRFSVIDDPYEADAKLMAAAPEMLECLQRLIAVHDSGYTPDEAVIQQLRQVAQKATGAEQ